MKNLSSLLLFALMTTNAFGASLPKNMSCLGTEPFWNITFTDSKLTYEDPVVETAKVYSKISIQNNSEKNSTITALDEENNFVKLNLTKMDCSDDMSDEIYPYSVEVKTSTGPELMGCCFEGL